MRFRRAITYLIVLLLAVTACRGKQDTIRVPFEQNSPWPKFRYDAAQSGRTAAKPKRGGQYWVYQTSKGIFSSPVVASDGTIYIGSADRYFYALDPDGSLRWRFLTGEIIDSAGLLDNLGRVYFGSGDGKLRALNRFTGDLVWEFVADDPSANGAFINWFEGNVAMAANGDLIAPNDNYFVYRIDRNNGQLIWKFRVPEQTWSLPALELISGALYFGNLNVVKILGDNIFAVNANGQKLWSEMSLGSMVASPLLTDEAMIIGGFDGMLQALRLSDGKALWQQPLAARDHFYASAAQLSNGVVVAPAADGTLYALDPRTGELQWAFDSADAIRSSPAVDGNDVIYFGSGNGRLYAINPDGSHRWSLQLIKSERNDLNGSPALGERAIYIAGESGEIFSVPYDYCLLAAQANNADCQVGGNEELPQAGAQLLYTSQFGNNQLSPPSSVDANAVLAFSLVVREGGNTVLALIDTAALRVTAEPPVPLTVRTSGDRKFLTVSAASGFSVDSSGQFKLKIKGDYLTDFERSGLRFTGGRKAGTFSGEWQFALNNSGPVAMPLPYPETLGGQHGVWELSRLAAPLPTILPSYNQIGFDSLHFLIGLVEQQSSHYGIGWLIGAKLAEAENRTVVDPETRAMFPVEIAYDRGAITFASSGGLRLVLMNAEVGFDTFRISGRIDALGRANLSPSVEVTVTCADLGFFAPFLRDLGFCNPDNDVMLAYGAIDLAPFESGIDSTFADVGTLLWGASEDFIEVQFQNPTLALHEYAWGILLIDAATNRPLPLDYGTNTERSANANGNIERIELTFEPGRVPSQVRALLMVNTAAVAEAVLSIP